MLILVCSLLGALFGVCTLRKWRHAIIPFGYSDSLIPTLVMREVTLHRGSLVPVYASDTAACADWPWQLLQALPGFSLLRVEALRYTTMLVLAAMAVGTVATAFGAGLPAATLGVCLLLGSRFSEVGWWFRPAFTFFPTHGLLAMAAGACLIGLALQGHAEPALFVAAGLLASYHPVHGLIVGGVLAGLALFGILPAAAPTAWLGRAGAWCLGLTPLAALLARRWLARKPNAPNRAPVDPRLWWQLMTVRTRNIFAAAGLDARSGGGGLRTLTSPPVLAALVGLLALWGLSALPVPPRAFAGAIVLWLAGLAGFVAQWIVSDRLRIPVLARLALARAGTYGTFVVCVAWAMLAVNAIERGGWGGALVVLLALAAISWPSRSDNSWLAALSLLPLIAGHIPAALPRLLLGVPALLVGAWVLVPAVVARVLAPARAKRLADRRDRLLATFRLAAGDKVPLLLLAIATPLALLPRTGAMPGAPVQVISLALPLLALVLALRVALSFRSPLHITPAVWEDLQRWAREATPPGSLFAVPPHLSGFEVFSHRPKLMDGLDIQMSLYVPALVQDVVARCAAYGVDLFALKPMELMPRLATAHRQLTPESLDAMQSAFGVSYAVFEKRQFNRLLWAARPILFENPEFVVVAPLVEQSPPRLVNRRDSMKAND